MNKELIEAITDNFPVSPVPYKVEEHQEGTVAGAADFPNADELCAIRGFFSYPWPVIASSRGKAMFNEVYNGVYYLTPDAFRYYLPALMTLAVTNAETNDWQFSAEWAIQLGQLLEPSRNDWCEKRCGPLNEIQKKVVAQFVHYIKDAYPLLGYEIVTPSCASYWAQFDQK